MLKDVKKQEVVVLYQAGKSRYSFTHTTQTCIEAGTFQFVSDLMRQDPCLVGRSGSICKM